MSLPGGLGVSDLHRLTAFADYIVPVGLRVLGIFGYSDALEEAISSGSLIEAGSPQEVELRAHTIYATALLTDEVERPPPARAAGDRPADRRPLLAPLPQDAPPASPDAHDLLLSFAPLGAAARPGQAACT